MIVIFIGIPGAGKGTIANLFKKKYAFKHISTGEILRKEVALKSELGNEVKKILDNGELVSDEIMIDIIKKNVNDPESNWILDGFPRTKKQAEGLEKIIKVSHVLHIIITNQVALKRLLARRDEQGRKREDDKKEIIKNRIDLFYKQVNPLLRHYREQGLVLEINGEGTIVEVFERVVKHLNL